MPARPLLAVGLAAALGLFAPGCKSTDNVESDKIDETVVHQAWEVSFNDNPAGGETHVFARFRVGGGSGTNVILVPPGAAIAAGQNMTPSDRYFLDRLPGRHYESRLDGFRQQVGVEYRTRTGQVFANTLRLERADFPPGTAAVWSRGRGVTVPFAGPPLTDGEAVELHVSSDRPPAPGTTSHTAIVRATRVGTTAVTVKPSDLAPLVNGPGKALWLRSSGHPLQQGNRAGGTLSTMYHSKPLPITLAD